MIENVSAYISKNNPSWRICQGDVEKSWSFVENYSKSGAQFLYKAFACRGVALKNENTFIKSQALAHSWERGALQRGYRYGCDKKECGWTFSERAILLLTLVEEK